MSLFRTIGIIGLVGNNKVLEIIYRLNIFLIKRSINVLVEDSIAANMCNVNKMSVCSRQIMGKICDLVVVVGGDGSMLGAARAVANANVPLLGINLGSLGFITDILPDELELKVGEVIDGKFNLENRLLLDVFVYRNKDKIGEGDALNDVVLHPGISTNMITFDLYIDEQFVFRQKADGLIIATPTGSTAYALSAGGPILHPNLDAIVIVPMHPHMLSSRPIVVDSNSKLKINFSNNMDIYPKVSCDGQTHLNCTKGDIIAISKKKQKLRLIHPVEYNYYNICRNKLGWGECKLI